ncbi:Uncharacterised protein [Klebsiella pneumoniae]|nr:Uncharacterised protein [Klebsiella pneumoniae]VAQ84846.1 Uncharacterised protein [Klebsiella pneumoniae]
MVNNIVDMGCLVIRIFMIMKMITIITPQFALL